MFGSSHLRCLSSVYFMVSLMLMLDDVIFGMLILLKVV